MTALYSLLPTLHHQLAEKLEASHLPLLVARDSLAYVPIPDIGQPVPAIMQAKGSEGEEGTAQEVSIRAFRADAYRQVEAEKWQAFYEACILSLTACI